MRQGHPLVVIEKKLGEPTEITVTYRKELSPRSKVTPEYLLYFLIARGKKYLLLGSI